MPTQFKNQPQPKQARAVDTIELVIQVANRALDAGGESAVRIQEISKEANVSIGSIYHHFGDRDGLIRATYVARFRNAIQDDISRVKRFMERMHSAKEMAEHYDEMLAFLHHYFEQFPAQSQARTIGSIAGRPPLRDAIIEVQSELTASLTEVMQLLKDRGILKPHLDAKSAAVMTLGMLHGRVISELDQNPVSDTCWNTAFLTAFSGLFVGADDLAIWKQLAAN